MANPTQLYLLADHIKLSLLERQRAISLNIEPNSQDGHISRSLDSMRDGIDALEAEQHRLSENRDTTPSLSHTETTTHLRAQYNDLTSQFQGFPTNTPSPSPPPRPSNPPTSSFLKRSTSSTTNSPNLSKSVRFRDSPPSEEEEEEDSETATRSALFPYRDDPSSSPPLSSRDPNLSNQQMLTRHDTIIREQDDQLDRLGESISRQRDLSIQIGDELDEHVAMLEDVEGGMDRQQGTLDGARRRVGRLLKRGGGVGWGGWVIAVLVLVLVILVVILKS